MRVRLVAWIAVACCLVCPWQWLVAEATGKTERMIPRPEISSLTRKEPLAPAMTPEGVFEARGSELGFSRQKWEYQPDESAPKIVKADTNEVALDLSDQPAGNGFGFAAVIWAPDSKRLAFNYGQGRTHSTSLYQLQNGKWVALNSPSEDNDIEKRANDIVADQLKAQELVTKEVVKTGQYLRLIWWTVNVDRWVDSNTAIAYGSRGRSPPAGMHLAKWMMATAPIFFLRCGSTVLASGRSSKRIGCRRKKSKSTNELFFHLRRNRRVDD